MQHHIEVCMQAPVRTNDLLNAVRCISRPGTAELTAAFPCLPVTVAGQSDDIPMPPLVGSSYYEAKELMLLGEQLVLRTTHFDIALEHPHKYLLNMCRALHCPARTVQLAVCLANDAMLFCKCSLDREPAAVAGACLHLAALLSGEARLLQPGWHSTLGLGEAETDDIGAELLTAVTQNQQA